MRGHVQFREKTSHIVTCQEMPSMVTHANESFAQLVKYDFLHDFCKKTYFIGLSKASFLIDGMGVRTIQGPEGPYKALRGLMRPSRA